MRLIRRILTLILFFFAGHVAKAQIAVAGDIAFSGYISDGTDQFSFVLLKSCTAGTVIHFTNNGWLGAPTNAFRSGEETVDWTCPAGGLNAGTEIAIAGLTATRSGAGAAGTVAGTGLNLSTSGDQVLAYVGTAGSPTFLSAIHMNVYTTASPNLDPCSTTAAAWDNTCANTTLGSALPPGLTTGVNCIWIGTQDVASSEFDNARFDCAAAGIDLTTEAGARAALNDQTKWTIKTNFPNPVGFTLPTGCNYLGVVCPTITVTNPAVTTGTAGTAFSQTFTQTGGATPVSFTTGSTLPAGLTLSTAGVLSGTPTQSGTFPIVVTATDNNLCTGTGSTYTLVISCPAAATPTITPSGPTTFCTGGSVTLTSSSATGNQWYLNGGAIPGATNQTYSATASGDYTVIVATAGTTNCFSSPSAVTTVIVNPTPPTPTITAGGATSFCAGGSVVLTSSSASGNQWYQTGVPIPTATNQTYTATASGDYTVVVTSGGCPSAPSNTITVTAVSTPTVNQPANQTACNNGPTTAVNFTGTGTTYSWTNNNTSIGLAAGGTGNIPSFTATNATSSPVTATITVTPSVTYTGALVSQTLNYTGASQTWTVPAGVISVILETYGAQGASGSTGSAGATGGTGGKGGYAKGTLAVTPGQVLNIYVGGTGSGATGGFNGGGFGVASGAAPSGGGGGASDVRVGGTTLANRVLVAGGGGGGGNGGNKVNAPGGIALILGGNGGDGNAGSGSAGTNSGGGGGGFGGVGATGGNPGAGCTGFIGTTGGNGVSGVGGTGGLGPSCCSPVYGNGGGGGGGFIGGGAGGASSTGTTGCLYNDNGGGGGGAAGSSYTGGVTSASLIDGQQTGNGRVIISYNVIGTCTGTPKTFTITVNPTATVNTVANQTVCNNAPTTAVTFSSPTSGGTIVYNWTNNTTSIGLAASGTGDIASFTATNATGAPVTATITVIPSYTNGGTTCTGTATTFTITVNPTATVTAVPNQTVCNNTATAAVTFSSPTTGGTIVYNWTNNTTSIGLGASGTGDITSFTATNATGAPVTATITVTPSYTNGGTTCVGTPRIFTITVNPTPTINAVSSQVVCNNSPTAAVNFSGNVTGTICATGDEGTNVVLTAPPGTVISAITFASYGTPNGACGAFSIGGCHAANSVSVVSGLAIGQNSVTIPATNATFGDPCGGTFKRLYIQATYSSVFNWTNNTPSIGLAASGTGNIASFNATNATTAPVTATITVTPSYTNGGTTCTGTATTFNITVNPTATVTAVPNQTVCNGSPTTAVTFSSPTTGGTIAYNWTNNTTSIGLGASGTGNIASFTATNATSAPVTATITVTPSYTNGGTTCVGTPRTFTITVNPTATVTTVPNQVVCNGAPTTAVTFSSPTTGGTIVYNWTNNTTSIGLGANGTGNIASFTATNATTAPVTATITVTPSYTNGAVTCVGTPSTFTITVNPTATVNAVSNQVVCNNSPTTAVTFSSPTTGGTIVYNWTNNTTSIGLAASGTGDIASFTATNATTGPVTATITVTPSYTNGGTTCVGTPRTFTITVNPTATVTTVPNQVVCNNSPTTAVTFTSPTTGGTIVYNWTNNTTSIGLAASGTGNIASFTATNAATAPVTATITVTPSYTNGAVTCTGTPSTFTITVNPTATVNAVANQVVCNGSPTTAVTFTSPTTGGTIVYNWTNNTTSIGLAASGSGNIASFTATNATTGPVTATITVTPSYTNGAVTCVGTASTFTITVNPTATVTAVPNQVVCNNSPTTAVTFTSPTTGGTIVYNWTNNTTSIGLAASGTGNIASFTATNATNAPVVATITVTPSYTNGAVTCTGTPRTFTITVNPTATLTAVPNQVVCNNSPTTAVTFTSPTTGGTIVYNWTNNTTSIGLAASGTGNIASFNGTNATNAPVTATITVTPSYTNGSVTCVGTPSTFTITVNPTATVNTVANQVVCNNSPTTAVTFTSPTTGGTIVYNWTNNTPSIGLAASGTGNIASFTATNATTGPVTATITVTPSYTNGAVTCIGTPRTFTITVNPTATVNTVANQTVCHNSPTAAVTFSSPTTGGTIVYNWTNSDPSIGLAASGTGNIPSFTAINTGAAAVTATITVTPSYTNGAVTCVGAPTTFTITVNTLSSPPTGATAANPILCGPGTTTLTAVGGFLGTGASYKWYTGSCGGTLVGTGPVLSNIFVFSTTTFFVRIEGVCNTTTCASVTVTVAPQPAVVITAVQSANGLPPQTLFATVSPAPPGAYTYQWRRDGVILPNNSDTLQIGQYLPGSYTVTVTSIQYGCTATSNTIIIFDKPSVVVYVSPNPNNGHFQVSYYAKPDEMGTTRNLLIYDSKGARIYGKAFKVTLPYNIMDVDLTGVQARGLYFLALTDQSGKVIASSKVMITK